MAIQAVLLDLDETLIHERQSTEAALAATLADASAQAGWDPRVVGRAVLEEAARLWAEGPCPGFCRRIGISSWEGLWANFAEGDDPDTRALRGFAPWYRREAWRRALARHGAEDPDLAADLSERFVWERALRQVPYPEVLEVLVALRSRGLRLAMVTNGDRDLQRRKARGSGLLPLFEHVVVSGQLGLGKPEPGIFHHALGLLGVEPDAAVMVGDSLARDVRGALGAGIRAVWVERSGAWSALEGPAPREPLPAGAHRIADLRGLLEVL